MLKILADIILWGWIATMVTGVLVGANHFSEEKMESRRRSSEIKKIFSQESFGVSVKGCVSSYEKATSIVFLNNNGFSIVFQVISYGMRGAEQLSNTWTLSSSERKEVEIEKNNIIKIYASRQDAQPISILHMNCPK